MGLSGLLAQLSAALPVNVPVDVPVDPDAGPARDLLADELAKQEYLAAKPTWFDQLIDGFTDWLDDLTTGSGDGGPPANGLLVTIIVIAAVVIVAFLVFGLPRLNRRSAVSGSLFGEDDERTAAVMRSAAQAAAAAGDYQLAIAEMFRSIARGLAERTVLSTSPGTTANDFAVRAGGAFPASAAGLASAASAFDDVRYLGRSGTKDQYEDVAALEQQLRTAKPVLTAVAP